MSSVMSLNSIRARVSIWVVLVRAFGFSITSLPASDAINHPFWRGRASPATLGNVSRSQNDNLELCCAPRLLLAAAIITGWAAQRQRQGAAALRTAVTRVRVDFGTPGAAVGFVLDRLLARSSGGKTGSFAADSSTVPCRGKAGSCAR